MFRIFTQKLSVACYFTLVKRAEPLEKKEVSLPRQVPRTEAEWKLALRLEQRETPAEIQESQTKSSEETCENSQS